MRGLRSAPDADPGKDRGDLGDGRGDRAWGEAPAAAAPEGLLSDTKGVPDGLLRDPRGVPDGLLVDTRGVPEARPLYTIHLVLPKPRLLQHSKRRLFHIPWAYLGSGLPLGHKSRTRDLPKSMQLRVRLLPGRVRDENCPGAQPAAALLLETLKEQLP